MNRKFLSAIFALLMCCVAGSARAESNESVYWGIKASGGAEIPGKWRGDRTSMDMYKTGYYLNVGAVANVYLGRSFYFEPGVSLFYSKYDMDVVVMADESGLDVSNPPAHKVGVQVPLVFGYSFQFPLNVYTGPQLRYAFAGGVDISDDIIKGAEDDFALWGVQRRFDLSWKVGVGVPVDNFNIALEVDLGVTDLLKGNMSFRENRVGFALTYFF